MSWLVRSDVEAGRDEFNMSDRGDHEGDGDGSGGGGDDGD